MVVVEEVGGVVWGLGKWPLGEKCKMMVLGKHRKNICFENLIVPT